MERFCSGIAKLKDDFEDWNWRFGKTPKFTISKSFPVMARVTGNSISVPECASATVVVEKGLIYDISLYLPPGLSSDGYAGVADLLASLKGQRFNEESLSCLENAFRGSRNKCTDKFVIDPEERVMTV